MTRVIDTNVPLVVKFGDDNPIALREACEDIIIEVIRGQKIVPTDVGGEILAEYFHQMSRSGAPTLADEFAKYVNDFRWSWPDGALLDIGPEQGVENKYSILEDDDQEIDPSDRKFVAVARAASVPIVQARDTKWLDWASVLARHGVVVHYAHEGTIREMYRKKFGRDAP